MGGNTGLHFACMEGNVDVARLLVASKKSRILNMQNNMNQAAIHLAAKHGHKDIVRMLMEHKAILGGEVSPLSYALASGSKPLVKKLLDSRCQVNEATERKQIKWLMESDETKKTPHVFTPNDEVQKKKERFVVTYSSKEDMYYTCLKPDVKGWEMGTEKYQNIFRNVDDDSEKVF